VREWGETMDKLTELLIITMEECGELTQACSKVLRKQDFEKRKLKGKKTLEESMKDLTKEVADVQCMIELLQTEGLVDWTEIRQGVEEKRAKLKLWSNLIS
jgi:NTP pyrophosphatase (non-canonical NTP hydrolase)